MTKRILFLGAVLFSCFACRLTADEWILDPLHSKIEFTADSRLVRTDGQFHKFAVKANVNDKQAREVEGGDRRGCSFDRHGQRAPRQSPSH